ncbi:MAG TPA: protein translocase subunit SecD [Bryobacteraceae bacterium]|nr:protein translocase subunit SecD [Bryobacteraceae bacterium]
MNKSLRVKAAVILAVILICIYGIIGIPKSRAELIANWNRNIKLGLDLRGGSHLVLQVQVQDAFKSEAAQVVDRLKDELNKAGIQFAAIDNSEPGRIEDADKVEVRIKGIPPEKAGTFRSIATESLKAWVLTPVSSTDYRLTMRPTDALELRQSTVKRSIDTIETRVNGLGLAESAVQQRGRSDGESEILVQLPGVDDPARIKQILQTAAMLELYEVKDGPFASEEEARVKHGGVLPLNTKLLKGAARGESSTGWLLVSRNPVVRGTDLRDAKPAQGELGAWETNFVLTQDAAKRFERYTEANIGNRLAIVLDNQWRSAPTIQNKISDNGRITGASSQQDASDLALVLKAGSLPASLLYLEERTVGPSLGADSIRQGLMAGIFGVGAVVLAMLIYYRRAGINATLALVLNALILIALLSYFEAVLTLPGIAGVILTIGMAVDSNVLIFERIREELRNGKAVIAAVDAGFSKALVTIIDTHVTTVVSCAVLFIFGTGPVKGFAVTLVIGLLANVFTAVFVSKFIFDWELSGKRQLTTLSI